MSDQNNFNLYYSAIHSFEQCDYDTAVKLFIEAYNSDINRDNIIENLYNCFITPNQQAFYDSFESSKIESHVKFENTSIDFIPVSDTKYYIFDKIKCTFSKPFEFQLTNNNAYTAESLLIIDDADISVAIEALLLKNYMNIYIVLTDKNSKILSLCKIPEFSKLYMKNTIVFESEKQFIEYFDNNADSYLPRTIIGNQKDVFQKHILHFHNNRIRNIQHHRNNVLLSICIPTFNRGLLALRDVNHILSCEYDAEIELIVSNNGSDITIGYDEIEQITDSRLIYNKFDKNMGSAYNFRTVLDKASGRFAVLCSDEDVLILEKLPAFLNFLANCNDIAFIRCSGIGNNFIKYNHTQYLDRFDSYSWALNSNYITGLTFNTSILKSYDVISKYDFYSSLPFAIHYPHCCIAFLCVIGGDACLNDIVLWKSEENLLEDDNNTKLLEYMRPESRLVQQKSCIEFVNSVIKTNERNFIPLFVSNILSKTFYLLELVYESRTEAFIKEYDWIETCLILYSADIDLVQSIYAPENIVYKNILNIINDIFRNALLYQVKSTKLTLKNQCMQKIVATLVIYMIDIGIDPRKICVDDIYNKIENNLFTFITI